MIFDLTLCSAPLLIPNDLSISYMPYLEELKYWLNTIITHLGI